MQLVSDPKDIPLVADVLSDIDFNDKSQFAESGKLNVRATLLLDKAIQLQEKLSKKSFYHSKANAVEIGAHVLKPTWTFFHGTNSSCLSSVEKKGLKRNNPDADMQTILTILNKIGQTTCFIGANSKHETQKIYVTGEPTTAILYAHRAPEWFDELCGQHFGKRDYEASRKHLIRQAEQWMKGHGCSEPLQSQDLSTLMQSFDRLWQKYGTGHPVVLSVKVTDGLSEEAIKQRLEQGKTPEEVKQIMLQPLSGKLSMIDSGIDNADIPPRNIKAYPLLKKDNY